MLSRSHVKFVVAVLIFFGAGAFIHAQWAPLVHDSNAEKRIEWWRQARFGMFMHWGVYSISGHGEWVEWNEQIPVNEYAKLANQFNPQHFDPAAWAALAKDGGMKYVVLTARHHDGFALFDDPESSFTSMKSAAHRDIVAEYTKAMRKAGLRVGLYYSPLDWRFPGFFFPGIYRQSADALRDQYQRQITELASHYGKLDILWFDGGGDEWLGFGGVQFDHGQWESRPKDKPYNGGFDWQDTETIKDLRALQPDIVINDRTNAAADFRSREGDRALGTFENQYPWELCTTITSGAWGYQPNARVKPLVQLIHLLIGAAGRDGNFLLNVSPAPDGQIPADQAERVREIGRWLRANGESIYGTRGGPWLPGNYGVSTHNGTAVYIHVLQAPGDFTVSLPTLPIRVRSASILGGGAIPFKQSDQFLTISIPAAAINPVDTIIKLELEEPWNTTAVVPVPSA